MPWWSLQRSHFFIILKGSFECCPCFKRHNRKANLHRRLTLVGLRRARFRSSSRVLNTLQGALLATHPESGLIVSLILYGCCCNCYQCWCRVFFVRFLLSCRVAGIKCRYQCGRSAFVLTARTWSDLYLEKLSPKQLRKRRNKYVYNWFIGNIENLSIS